LNATGLCANDPCELVHCGQGQNCVVGDDGSADCVIPAVTGAAIQTQSAGSGVFACSCSLASAMSSGHDGRLVMLMFVAGILLGRKRRDRSLK
jgi:MYXO-CTERM domain-containing protein